MAAKGSDKVLWWDIVAVVVVVVTVAVVVMVIVVVMVVVVVLVVTWTDWELLTEWGWLATEWRRLVVVAQLLLVEAIPAVPAPVPATTANHTALTVVQLLFFFHILFAKSNQRDNDWDSIERFLLKKITVYTYQNIVNVKRFLSRKKYRWPIFRNWINFYFKECNTHLFLFYLASLICMFANVICMVLKHIVQY